MIGFFSRHIGHHLFLAAILKQPCRRQTVFSATPSAVAGWGLKPTAKKARRYAQRNNLPYISLEDAFIRSMDLGVKGSQPLGLAVDYTGIYYDATSPSDLEKLIIGRQDGNVHSSCKCFFSLKSKVAIGVSLNSI